MTRILLAALIATGLGVASAAADAIIVYDANLGQDFAAKRQIVDLVKQTYGPATVYDSGQKIPKSVASNLVAGNKLPAGVEPTTVPEKLRGKLPHTGSGTIWVRLRRDLLELRPDGTIAMGVYDVLPAS